MTANGVDERERSGSVPEFLVMYRYLSSKNLAKRSEQQRTRTYDKRKTTISKQCPSELQCLPANAKFSPKFPVRWCTLGQFVIVRRTSKRPKTNTAIFSPILFRRFVRHWTCPLLAPDIFYICKTSSCFLSGQMYLFLFLIYRFNFVRFLVGFPNSFL